MRSSYSAQVWARFAAPQRAGELSNAAVGEAGTPASRARLRLYLKAAQGRIAEARFKAYGCVSTIAAADWVAEWATGKTPAQARGLSTGELASALQLAPVKRHCALLAQDALFAALAALDRSTIRS